jgi:hypothetical protein
MIPAASWQEKDGTEVLRTEFAVAILRPNRLLKSQARVGGITHEFGV